MDSSTIEATARNSDCQFCIVRFQKSAEVTYPTQDTGSDRSDSCSALYAARPATDCASQEPRKSSPIVSPREWEKTVRRQPVALAQGGESLSACRPTFWSSSDSRPTSSTGLDSVDPRCTNHTVASTNTKNCRYSDCQFSATSTANDDEVTYCQIVTGSPPVASCWLL